MSSAHATTVYSKSNKWWEPISCVRRTSRGSISSDDSLLYKKNLHKSERSQTCAPWFVKRNCKIHIRSRHSITYIDKCVIYKEHTIYSKILTVLSSCSFCSIVPSVLWCEHMLCHVNTHWPSITSATRALYIRLRLLLQWSWYQPTLWPLKIY